MICDRCGREQPVLYSPCPACGLLGSASSIPRTSAADGQWNAVRPQRGGEAEPSEPMSPGLRMAFVHAHRMWALVHARHLLREWETT